MAVQLQWSLDETAASTISVARGILHAATIDNIQPLAVLACERFGNTIAMCQETILRIERFVVPSPEPAVLTFLKSTVGYLPQDTVTQMGKSLAGVRFLGLAAAIISTLGPSEGAIAIQGMLVSTATDATLLPSIRNIRELLECIEAKCHQAGFADQFAGWQLFFGQLDPNLRHEFRTGRMHFVPKSQGMEALLNALRQLHRVGNEDITKLTIRTTSCAPWTIAFVKWCLGYPPSIFWDDGTPILDQGANVSVILQKDRSREDEFRVTTHSSIHGLSDLISTTTTSKPQAGMMGLKAFGELQMLHAFDVGLPTRAAEQALPYALRQAVKNLTTGSMMQYPDPNFDLRVQVLPPVDQEGLKLLPSPFPHDHDISRIYRLLFHKKLELKTLDEGLRITDLPVVRTYFRDVQEHCPCGNCRSDNPQPGKCGTDNFMDHVCTIVADVLALSLFDCPEPLQVYWLPPYGPFPNGPEIKMASGMSSGFYGAIRSILVDGVPGACSHLDIMSWVLRRVGHTKATEEHDKLVISSFKGQTIWPTLYESHVFEKRGYLQLSWAPGLLIHKKDVYQVATSASEFQPRLSVNNLTQTAVVSPCNLFPKMQLQWTVSVDSGGLKVSLGLLDMGKGYATFAQGPSSIFDTITSSYLLESCVHGADASLDEPDKFCEFTSPLQPLVVSQAEDDAAMGLTRFSFNEEARNDNASMGSAMELISNPSSASSTYGHYSAPSSSLETVSVVAIDGSDDLRLFTLSSIPGGYRVVLRR